MSEEERSFDYEIEKEYKRLVVEYAQALPAKANDLIKLVDSCFLQSDREAVKSALDSASKLAHKLAGSAGSHTFHILGEHLQKLNSTLSALLKDFNLNRLVEEKPRIKEMLSEIERLAKDASLKSKNTPDGSSKTN